MEFPDSVRCESFALANGQDIKLLTLNKPKALNALDFDMADALFNALTAWADDDSVSTVILAGEGEKAFCAGGDVVSMYRAMEKEPTTTPKAVSDFFTVEYKLDYLIHTYAKPIIVMGQGYVMGGGMGLYAGAKYRLVTPSTKLAMPEITIGLYPDVGGSYFLPRMPAGVGLFLGLTGIPFSGADALSIGFADAMVADNSIDALINDLQQASKKGDLDESAINAVINGQSLVKQQDSAIEVHQPLFEQLAQSHSLQAALNVLNDYQDTVDADDKWMNKALKTFKAGSPITAHLVWQQIKRGAELDLAECFKMELNMSARCASVGEFQEGVRALLIEKDGNPNWLYKDIDSVPADLIDSFFEPFAPENAHPLAALNCQNQE
jgi:enoyl-CoA hydratase/carnithine racemase